MFAFKRGFSSLNPYPQPIHKPKLRIPGIEKDTFQIFSASELKFQHQNLPFRWYGAGHSHLSLSIPISKLEGILPGYIQCSCLVAKQFMTRWTIVCQAPLSMGFLQARILEWVAIPFSRGSSQPRCQTHGSCTGRWIPYRSA